MGALDLSTKPTFSFEGEFFLNGRRILELSLNEHMLLTLLVLNRGDYINQDEIASFIWRNENPAIYSHNVWVHVHNLRNKLKMLGGESYDPIEHIRGQGWRWTG